MARKTILGSANVRSGSLRVAGLTRPKGNKGQASRILLVNAATEESMAPKKKTKKASPKRSRKQVAATKYAVACSKASKAGKRKPPKPKILGGPGAKKKAAPKKAARRPAVKPKRTKAKRIAGRTIREWKRDIEASAERQGGIRRSKFYGVKSVLRARRTIKRARTASPDSEARKLVEELKMRTNPKRRKRRKPAVTPRKRTMSAAKRSAAARKAARTRKSNAAKRSAAARKAARTRRKLYGNPGAAKKKVKVNPRRKKRRVTRKAKHKPQSSKQLAARRRNIKKAQAKVGEMLRRRKRTPRLGRTRGTIRRLSKRGVPMPPRHKKGKRKGQFKDYRGNPNKPSPVMEVAGQIGAGAGGAVLANTLMQGSRVLFGESFGRYIGMGLAALATGAGAYYFRKNKYAMAAVIGSGAATVMGILNKVTEGSTNKAMQQVNFIALGGPPVEAQSAVTQGLKAFAAKKGILQLGAPPSPPSTTPRTAGFEPSALAAADAAAASRVSGFFENLTDAAQGVALSRASGFESNALQAANAVPGIRSINLARGVF